MKSIITETEGVYGGSPVFWYTIENDGILYFYYQYWDSMNNKFDPEYSNYAIMGEQYILQCGVHVGMTKEEVYALLPNSVNCKPDNSKGVVVPGVLTWNVGSFPEGWCENYSDIIMINIDHDEEFPWYLGLMLDNNNIVRAITTCNPTAG